MNDDEELNKIIRKLEAMMKSTNDSSQYIAASMKALPDTLSVAVDDALFDRVQSMGKDIGEAMSKELGAYTDMLVSASASIARIVNTLTKFVRLLNVVATILMLAMLLSVVICMVTFKAYLSMDFFNSVLVRLPPHAALPMPTPLPPAQNSK